MQGADVSRQGVQRDLLPLVEGTAVTTKYGMIRTDHILFIASGAFHLASPSDLIPELQGRLPIRVELSSLSVEDFERILTATDACLTHQYEALLATEGVELAFTPEGVRRLAEIAFAVNERTENIGARRLYTVMEKLLEEVSFDAGRSARSVTIDAAYVDARLADARAERGPRPLRPVTHGNTTCARGAPRSARMKPPSPSPRWPSPPARPAPRPWKPPHRSPPPRPPSPPTRCARTCAPPSSPLSPTTASSCATAGSSATTFLATRPAPPIVLDWRPVYVEVAASGELGLPPGPEDHEQGQARAPPATASSSRSGGATAGPWKVEVDLGISHPEPALWEPAAGGAPASRGASRRANAALAEAEQFAATSRAPARAPPTQPAAPSDLRFYRSGAAPRSARAAALAGPRMDEDRSPGRVERIETARSGDFGYARGSYARAAAPRRCSGYYLRVWRREAGDWRVALDVANPAPPR